MDRSRRRGGRVPVTLADAALVATGTTSLRRVLNAPTVRNGDRNGRPVAEHAVLLLAVGLLLRERVRAERWERA